MHVTKEETHRRNLERLTRATATLKQVTTQQGIPKNIKMSIRDVLAALQDEKVAVGLRIVNAISLLEGTTQDPALPSFARVEIWSAVSELESIREWT